MKTYTRITNSNSCAFEHTITAINVSEGYVHLSFSVDMPLSAIVQATNDDGYIENIDTCKIEYPANGEVKFTPSAGGIAESSSVLCVADVAGSLNNKYFLISSPTVDYYVWYNVSSGGSDPSVASRTGIEVAITTADTAATVATNTKTALDAVTGVFTTTRDTATLTITNQVVGEATDTGAGNSGFTVSTINQGVFPPSEGVFSLEAGKKLTVIAFRNSSSVGTYTS